MHNKGHGGKKIDFSILKRLLKMLLDSFPVMFPVVIASILITSAIRSMPSIYLKQVIAVVEDNWRSGDWASAYPLIKNIVISLLILYAISTFTSILYNQLMAVITQQFLKDLRTKMFGKMQDLPIKYFDTNQHGDIMSHYTNDIDAIRQLISMTLPQVFFSLVMIITVFIIMLRFSIWLSLVVLIGLMIMFMATKKIGGNAGQYFKKQQKSLGETEGFVEEIMHGQKVVKVFNEEQAVIDKFDELNNQLCEDAKEANKFANMLMPIMGNIGNILYVVVAIVGGALIILGTPNISLSGAAMSVSIVVPFLNMTKQFSGNIAMLTSQVNAVAMALAGAERVFNIIDQEPELDEGNITLVRSDICDRKISEVNYQSGCWAWKRENADGSVEYRELKGDVRLDQVNFGYEEDQAVLKDITLFAEPGQKVAFVGATGAGKTTITNLINRFYEINHGSITYDGIDIKDIRKRDLRKSMGLVLQDTNLFSGTVMDNIRYGNMEAKDEECIAAAKLAGAHDFISRLPEGYHTVIDGNNDSLSQGQRQLLSIARAAILDPPVMVLDEATSSIDTRTEAIVQKGMDELMKGRTVFVIAHRLSTIRNSDVIMVLDRGHIVERGSHSELLAQKGYYYQLYTGAFELD